MPVLEHPRQHPVGGADRQQVEQRSTPAGWPATGTPRRAGRTPGRGRRRRRSGARSRHRVGEVVREGGPAGDRVVDAVAPGRRWPAGRRRAAFPAPRSDVASVPAPASGTRTTSASVDRHDGDRFGERAAAGGDPVAGRRSPAVPPGVDLPPWSCQITTRAGVAAPGNASCIRIAASTAGTLRGRLLVTRRVLQPHAERGQRQHSASTRAAVPPHSSGRRTTAPGHRRPDAGPRGRGPAPAQPRDAGRSPRACPSSGQHRGQHRHRAEHRQPDDQDGADRQSLEVVQAGEQQPGQAQHDGQARRPPRRAPRYAR